MSHDTRPLMETLTSAAVVVGIHLGVYVLGLICWELERLVLQGRQRWMGGWRGAEVVFCLGMAVVVVGKVCLSILCVVFGLTL